MRIPLRLQGPITRTLTGVAASAALCGLCAWGGWGWALAFVMLVPWLVSLDSVTSLWATVLSACLMSIAFTASVFWWFGVAIGDYTGVGATTGLVTLLALAPWFQAQFVLFAVVRRQATRSRGAATAAGAGAAAWVAAEWVFPKMLGDTLSHGLYASAVLRQMADLVGTAGLTLLMLVCNGALAIAWAERRGPPQRWLRPVVAAVAVPLVLGAYGGVSLLLHPQLHSESLRVGLVQANIVDYEQRRQRIGAEAVVREVLDTHFAMSYDAVEHQHADVVVWSETVYPTTFSQPKSEAGAEFDAAILSIVDAAQVPFVFGTYDRDAQGEYNAAAFVQPGTGLLGFYRKTRLFPFTEYVPAWLDYPWLRDRLPWMGHWQAGNGARVFPLRLRDGREVPVMTAICLDDVDTALALDGARLGARALLTMSNDSWFSRHPQGAALHQAAAAFRSIETRLPQYRVTTNGFSAIIDSTGTVVAGSAQGVQTLVVGELPLPAGSRTLMTAWGDWVGPASCLYLAWLTLLTATAGWRKLRGTAFDNAVIPDTLPSHVFVLSPTARVASGALRALARVSLLGLGAAMLLDDHLRGNTLAQIRLFAGWFLVPELLSWAILWAYRARIRRDGDTVVLSRGTQHLEVPIGSITQRHLWRCALPMGGISFQGATPDSRALHLACRAPLALYQALAVPSQSRNRETPPAAHPARSLAHFTYSLYATRRGRLDALWLKFLLFPALLAIPAFILHQNIAYGGSLGELYTFGGRAYLVTLGLWWAAWAMGVFLTAAALRALLETIVAMTVVLAPRHALPVRTLLQWVGHALLYLGLPGWLALHAGF